MKFGFLVSFWGIFLCVILGSFRFLGHSVSVFENVRLKNWELDICNLSTFLQNSNSSLDEFESVIFHSLPTHSHYKNHLLDQMPDVRPRRSTSIVGTSASDAHFELKAPWNATKKANYTATLQCPRWPCQGFRRPCQVGWSTRPLSDFPADGRCRFILTIGLLWLVDSTYWYHMPDGHFHMNSK